LQDTRKRKKDSAMRLRIKEIAEQKGINKSQLSRRCDMTQETIAKLWTDSDVDAADAKTSTLEKIAEVLNVNVKDLIVG
jgi:DNA-binding Xre family transcriptional regulator